MMGETRVLDKIDAADVVEMARQLIRRPSVNPPGDYAAVAAYVMDVFKEMGLAIRVVEGEPGRPNIVGLLRGTGGRPGFCLSSHMDVVGTLDASQWQHPPFEAVLADGVLHGRGSADSKGMLAAMIGAVKAIQAAGLKLQGDLYLVAAVDDETAGQFGLRHVIVEKAMEVESAILGEATNFDITHVFKGRIWFELEAIGKSSHGAFPQHGINAILKAYKVIQAVYGIRLGSHPRLGEDTISLGTIRGGTVVNVGPQSCTPAFDIRWGPPLTSRDIRARVMEAVRQVQQTDPDLKVGEIVASEERDPLEFPESVPLIRALQDGVKGVRGRAGGLVGWYSSGEIYHMHRLGGIKVGVIFGPGMPWMAHAFNEQIEVKDLVDGARVYALAALAQCGVA